MTEAERRRTVRLSLEVPALLSTIDESGVESSFEVMTKNICSGGAFLSTNRPLSPGTEVKMDMVLSFMKELEAKEKKSHIYVSGWVLRTEEHGVAVCFNEKYSIAPIYKWRFKTVTGKKAV